MNASTPTSACSVACVCMVTQQMDALARFYRDAFGFQKVQPPPVVGIQFGRDAGLATVARSERFALGQQHIELWEFAQPGRSVPDHATSASPSFQHFAIVVVDMAAAYRHLETVAGWSAISSDGPQLLPPSSGGVSAFKFRDPEGHPLELLAFPDRTMPPRWREQRARAAAGTAGNAVESTALGIDHTAIVVADAAVSIAFYAGFGFHVGARSRNVGPAQAHLDALDEPDVGVIALQPTHAPPHLELLCYAPRSQPEPPGLAPNDIAATRTVIAVSLWREGAREVIDPDGHRLVITPAAH